MKIKERFFIQKLDFSLPPTPKFGINYNEEQKDVGVSTLVYPT